MIQVTFAHLKKSLFSRYICMLVMAYVTDNFHFRKCIVIYLMCYMYIQIDEINFRSPEFLVEILL